MLQIKINDVNLKDGSICRGLKTKAGINRLVPIHKRIKPFIEELYDPKNTYLYDNNGDIFTYNIVKKNFIKSLNRLGINHTLHECRHPYDTVIIGLSRETLEF